MFSSSQTSLFNLLLNFIFSNSYVKVNICFLNSFSGESLNINNVSYALIFVLASYNYSSKNGTLSDIILYSTFYFSNLSILSLKFEFIS